LPCPAGMLAVLTASLRCQYPCRERARRGLQLYNERAGEGLRHQDRSPHRVVHSPHL
jgi:hypothetical protein